MKHDKGMTLIEVLIAMFIFVVGIIGILGAMPSGVSAAHQIIFQDAAIHLSRSKFAEFRRDRVDPRVDLVTTARSLDGASSPLRVQEPQNGNAGGWRDFTHGSGDIYENFDNIEQYQWVVDQWDLVPISVDSVNGNIPIVATGAGGLPDLQVTRVTVVVGMKGSSREQRFTQYMYSYGK